MKEYAREIMAFGVVALFAYAFFKNPDEDLLVGAIIAAFSTAYGFYLGGSKVGSDTAAKNADTVAENARSTIVHDGEPQPVVIQQPKGEPVPVEETRP